MTTDRATIRIGVAGWDYPDWQGTVYPRCGLSRPDRLGYLARFVDVVEINSTFYRPATRRSAESWVRRTRAAPGFRFTAKAHRSWTHEIADDLPRAVRETLDGLTPLRDAGMLSAVLVQFPQRVHAEPESLEHIDRLHDLTRGWPLAVEVRHRSWLDPEIDAWFGARAIARCAVDQPRVGSSTLPWTETPTADLAYIRLHGRNAARWFDPEAGRDARYDYRYTPPEVAQLAAAAGRIAGRAREVIAVANNHFRGQALAAAIQLRHAVGSGRPLAPGVLLRTYPDLADVAVAEQDELFS